MRLQLKLKVILIDQWLFAILGLIAVVFIRIKGAKFLSKMKVSPKVKKLNYTSQELDFS
jgi:hypothetical protein